MWWRNLYKFPLKLHLRIIKLTKDNRLSTGKSQGTFFPEP